MADVIAMIGSLSRGASSYMGIVYSEKCKIQNGSVYVMIFDSGVSQVVVFNLIQVVPQSSEYSVVILGAVPPKPPSEDIFKNTKPEIKARLQKMLNKTPIKVEEINKAPIQEEEINKKVHKIKNAIVKGTAKARSEKRKSIDSNQPIDTSDDKTVITDTTPQIESYKINTQSLKSLMAKYKDLSDSATIDDFDPEDQVKMKGYMKAIGVPIRTKKMSTLRKKF